LDVEKDHAETVARSAHQGFKKGNGVHLNSPMVFAAVGNRDETGDPQHRLAFPAVMPTVMAVSFIRPEEETDDQPLSSCYPRDDELLRIVPGRACDVPPCTVRSRPPKTSTNLDELQAYNEPSLTGSQHVESHVFKRSGECLARSAGGAQPPIPRGLSHGPKAKTGAGVA
jgi:hypothetical protein